MRELRVNISCASATEAVNDFVARTGRGCRDQSLAGTLSAMGASKVVCRYARAHARGSPGFLLSHSGFTRRPTSANKPVIADRWFSRRIGNAGTSPSLLCSVRRVDRSGECRITRWRFVLVSVLRLAMMCVGDCRAVPDLRLYRTCSPRRGEHGTRRHPVTHAPGSPAVTRASRLGSHVYSWDQSQPTATVVSAPAHTPSCSRMFCWISSAGGVPSMSRTSSLRRNRSRTGRVFVW
ncbi:hypothetical protein Mal4_52220 [Maioricimonas rarisocia]|uniref:Uncharacterized protein n=1 Tax=Maioricimonas rarisocia TaxID=2528026 RepID=A0A517ZEK3_9PLAN|nr:hypothetical protein Mal4_52220 [Maioricimonas rarisocia]